MDEKYHVYVVLVEDSAAGYEAMAEAVGSYEDGEGIMNIIARYWKNL